MADGACMDVDLGIGGDVERREGPPSALEFQRDFVSRNKPVVFTSKDMASVHKNMSLIPL